MRWLLVVLLLACGGPRSSPKIADPPPPSPDAAVASVPIDATIDAMVDAPPPAPPPPPALALDAKPPAVKGTPVKVEVGKTVNVGGIAVAFVGQNHKHPAGRGRALGMWTFKVAGAEHELRSTEDHFEAELVAGGVVLVFRHVDYGTFEVIPAGKAAKPLDEDACVALIEKQATARSLPDGVNGYSSAEHGVMVAHSKRWNAHCGQYTKRVWFTARGGDTDSD